MGRPNKRKAKTGARKGKLISAPTIRLEDCNEFPPLNKMDTTVYVDGSSHFKNTGEMCRDVEVTSGGQCSVPPFHASEREDFESSKQKTEPSAPKDLCTAEGLLLGDEAPSDLQFFVSDHLQYQVETTVCVDGTTYFINAEKMCASADITSGSHGDAASFCSIEQNAAFGDCAEKAAPRLTPGDAFYTAEDTDEGTRSNLQFFISQGLRHAIQKQLETYRRTFYLSKPEEMILGDFIVSEELEQHRGTIKGFTNSLCLARNRHSGKFLALRRLHNLVLRNTRTVQILEKWRTLCHPNVVQIQSITTSHPFAEASVLFAYEYFPNAITLETLFTSKKYEFDEHLVWSFAVQLVSGLRAIHGAGLAARLLSPRTLLLSSIDYCTLRINCTAIVDVIEVADIQNAVFQRCYYSEHKASPKDQRRDIVNLGEVMNFMATCLDQSGILYSQELSNFIKKLRSGNVQLIENVVQLLGTYAFDQLDNIQMHKDVLEREIWKEVDNGRLLRLMILITQVMQECHAFSGVPSSHLGEEEQLIRLFGNFLFGQRSLYHVISTLNKLDAGVHEMIHLGNRRSEGLTRGDLYIVSYAELLAMFLRRYSSPSVSGLSSKPSAGPFASEVDPSTAYSLNDLAANATVGGGIPGHIHLN